MEHAADVGAHAVLDIVEGAVVPLRVSGIAAERLPMRRRRRGRGDSEDKEEADEDSRNHGARNPMPCILGAPVPVDRRERGRDAEEGRGQRGGTADHGKCVVSPSLGVAVALRSVPSDFCGLLISPRSKLLSFFFTFSFPPLSKTWLDGFIVYCYEMKFLIFQTDLIIMIIES